MPKLFKKRKPPIIFYRIQNQFKQQSESIIIFKHSYMRLTMLAQSILPKRNFSSLKPTNIVLIRHAESVFNALCHKYPQEQVYGKQAQQQFHFNPQVLDCSLTEYGLKSANSIKIINFFKNKSSENTMFFVSPMLRTLQTTKSILDIVGINFQVVVLPQLTEILSKICDFSSGIKNKKQQFPQFDFEYFDQWVKEKGLSSNSQHWQDHFLDINIRQNLGNQTDAQKRYIEVLRSAFPKQVQNIEKCEKRSIQGIKKIYDISQRLNRKNAIVVSHNRILKNIQKFILEKEPQDYDNLEIRKLKINQSNKQLLKKNDLYSHDNY